MGIIQNFLLISLKSPTPSAGLGPCEAKETAVGPTGDADARPSLVKRTLTCAPMAPEPFHFNFSVIKAAGWRAQNHHTPEREGLYGVGAGYFQSVLPVARTFDSQITAWAHLCRLGFLRRSLTPDSCVGCLPNPNGWTSARRSLSRKIFDSGSWPGPV